MVWFLFDVVWENNWFPCEMTWAGRNERRNSILMTRHYPDLGSVADRLWCVGNLLQPIIKHFPDPGSDAPIHQYEISVLVSQTSCCKETSGAEVAKCRLSSEIWCCLNVTKEKILSFFFQGQQNPAKTFSEYVDFDIRKNNQYVNLKSVYATWSNHAWGKKRPAFFK